MEEEFFEKEYLRAIDNLNRFLKEAKAVSRVEISEYNLGSLEGREEMATAFLISMQKIVIDRKYSEKKGETDGHKES